MKLAGKVVEVGSAEAVLRSPSHPYTRALLDAMPRAGVKTLESITGQPPDLSKLDAGCAFAPRCAHRFERCATEPGLLPVADGHGSACWLVEAGLAHQGTRERL